MMMTEQNKHALTVPDDEPDLFDGQNSRGGDLSSYPGEMMQQIVLPEAIEQVVVNGDLSPLNAAQRVQYVNAVCKSMGLNHLTKPFNYIKLNGKLTLYATKDCTDQLRRIYGISVIKVEESNFGGAAILVTHVKDKSGRTDQARAAIDLSHLKGDSLANAIMKLETKSKRRATLSICGLGFLDESELETVGSDARMPENDLGAKTADWDSGEDDQPQPDSPEVVDVDPDEELIQEIQVWLESHEGLTIDHFNAAVAKVTEGQFLNWRDLPDNRKQKLTSTRSLNRIKKEIDIIIANEEGGQA